MILLEIVTFPNIVAFTGRKILFRLTLEELLTL